MSAPPLPPVFAPLMAALPDEAYARLIELRELIWRVADDTGIAPLTETLKWGQMAWLPPRGVGTTIRLGWSHKTPETCRMFVHCQTDLLARYDALFGDAFSFEGNRAVLVPVTGSFDAAAFQQMAAMALSYHRDKRAAR